MRSRKAPRGPLSPFEKTLAQFYRYLGRTLVPVTHHDESASGR